MNGGMIMCEPTWTMIYELTNHDYELTNYDHELMNYDDILRDTG